MMGTNSRKDGAFHVIDCDRKESTFLTDEILLANSLFANISLDADAAENIVELDGVLNKPQTTTFEKTPNRNDPCSCGSGKKYKKCCG